MNTKVIVGGIVVILIIIGAIYFVSKGVSSNPSATGQAAGQQTGNASSTGQVQGQDVSIGTGAQAQPGDTVSVLYVGYLGRIATSTIFDSSAAHGNKPLVFALGTNNLIAGFQIGVNGMKVGGERLLVVPPTLGYGNQDVKDASGKVIIPAGSTLVFDIKLVAVQPGSTTPATSQPATH